MVGLDRNILRTLRLGAVGGNGDARRLGELVQRAPGGRLAEGSIIIVCVIIIIVVTIMSVMGIMIIMVVIEHCYYYEHDYWQL